MEQQGSFFDRDLNNFRLLFDLRAIDAGVIITRCTELQTIFNRLGRGPSFGNSTTHMAKLRPRLDGGSGGGCPVVVSESGRPAMSKTKRAQRAGEAGSTWRRRLSRSLEKRGAGSRPSLADPPWQFTNRTGKIAPEHKRLARYGTMKLDEIMALPVAQISPRRHRIFTCGARTRCCRKGSR